MGKGGLNRILLTSDDISSPHSSTTTITLPACDRRATHIRTILRPDDTTDCSTLSLRVAVEHEYLHDEALATIQSNGDVILSIPSTSRKPLPSLPPIILLLAMQRPKAMGRILEQAAMLGVQMICIIGADKVERSYWDCKLFRAQHSTEDEEEKEREEDRMDDCLPGRKHMHRKEEGWGWITRRVDELPAVRRRLQLGVEQAACDAQLPVVWMERRGVDAAMKGVVGDVIEEGWKLMMAHPGGGNRVTQAVTEKKLKGIVMAIGPEGGWTEQEVMQLQRKGFQTVTLAERVLRSETAVVVALALVQEALAVSGMSNER